MCHFTSKPLETFSLFLQCKNAENDPFLGAKKSTQTFFVQSFSKTLRVMGVRAKNRGRPRQKIRFSAAPVMGRNFLTQGRPGVRVRNVRGKSGPKSLCLCCFFFPEVWTKKVHGFSVRTPICHIVVGVSRGNTIRGNRTERF